VGLCVQDYQSLRIAVMICVILVDTQTDRHADRRLVTGYTISSASLHVFSTVHCMATRVVSSEIYSNLSGNFRKFVKYFFTLYILQVQQSALQSDAVK